jgi:hypothetical protein
MEPSADASRPQKKRKWDLGGELTPTEAAQPLPAASVAAVGTAANGTGGQIGIPASADPIERARQVAAALAATMGQQRLAHALAKLPIPQPAAPQQQSGVQPAEVAINDAPAHIRINLVGMMKHVATTFV